MRLSAMLTNTATHRLILLTMAVSSMAVSSMACFPVVPVPPAVQPGLRVSIGATAHYTQQRESWIPDSTQVKPEIFPQAMFLASFGIVGSDPRLPRLRATYYLNSGFGLGGALHLQAPVAWTGSWDAGVSGFVQGGETKARGITAALGKHDVLGNTWWVNASSMTIDSPYDASARRVGNFLLSRDASMFGRKTRLMVGAVVGDQDLRCGESGEALPPMGSVPTCPRTTRAFLGTAIEFQPRWQRKRPSWGRPG